MRRFRQLFLTNSTPANTNGSSGIRLASSYKNDSAVSARSEFVLGDTLMLLTSTEIEETQRRLEQALRELSMTKEEEEEILRQKVIECQREFKDAMAKLQEQFVEQVPPLFPTAPRVGGVYDKADELKTTTMAELAQYRSQCETAIESRAKTLSATLTTGTQLFSALHVALRSNYGLQNRGRFRKV